jgi:hypothetical protein
MKMKTIVVPLVALMLVTILLMAGLMVMAGCGGGGTNSSPIANAGSNYSVQVGDIVSFSGTGTDADGSIAKYEWDFDGDGIYDWSSGTTGATTHIYGTAGTYVAVFRVTDNEGAVDTDTRTITVSQKTSTVDITGTWSGDWWRSDGGEEGTLIATLTQSASSLSGDMTFTSTTFSYSRDTTVSGSVQGNEVVFGIAIGGNGSTVTIAFEGTLTEDSNQMSGTYSMSTGYTGTWSVTRE